MDTDLTEEEAANEGLDYDGDCEVPLDHNRMIRLRSMHTRQLLALLRGTYSRSSWWEGWEAQNFDEPTRKEIKVVLKTREHIPDKKEGKMARKKRAKTHREARNNRYIRRR